MFGRVTNRLNRKHPLASGLVAFHLALPRFPALGTVTTTLIWRDLAGNFDLSAGNFPGFVPSVRPGALTSVPSRTSTTTMRRSTSVPISGAPLTMAGWFNPTSSVATTYGLMNIDDNNAGGGNSFSLFQSTGGKLGVYTEPTATTTVTTASVPGVGKWYFSAGTWTPTTHAVFLNGANKVSASVSSTPTGMTFYRLGNDQFNDGFVGQFDCCMVWNRVLSDHEIYQAYIETARGCPGLILRAGFPTFGASPVTGGPFPFFLDQSHSGGFCDMGL